MSWGRKSEGEPSGYFIECSRCGQIARVCYVPGKLGPSRSPVQYEVDPDGPLLPLTEVPQFQFATCNCGHTTYFNQTKFQ